MFGELSYPSPGIAPMKEISNKLMRCTKSSSSKSAKVYSVGGKIRNSVG